MAGLSLPLKLTLGLLAAGAVGLVAVLARFWGANPEYADRFLIVLGAGWIAWERRGELEALPRRAEITNFWSAFDSSRVSGWILLIIGASAFPVGWYLQAQVAPKPVVIWWIGLAWLFAAAGVVLVLGGWRHLRAMAFPLVFLLFALPIPNRILVPLQDKLQRATTTAAAAVLPLLHIPIERDGFILRLPGGDLGVAEACSGVRSVTALTALAAFVACMKNFGPARGITLLALSVPVIAAVNAFRVVLTGMIQEWIGAAYIQGNWHEALGIGMVFLGLGVVVGLANLLDRRKAIDEAANLPTQEPSPETVSTPEGSTRIARSFASEYAALGILALAAITTITAQFVGQSAEQQLVATAPLDELPLAIGKWTGEPHEVSDYVTELLTYDKVAFRTYRNDIGQKVDAWVIFWSSQSMVKGYHHPDICVANRGFVVREKDILPLAVDGGGTVPVTVREFVHHTRSSDRQLILYWTQEGRRVWSDKDEESARLTGDSHRWVSDRLFGTPEVGEDGRIVVLLGTELTGEGKRQRAETLDFAKQLAGAVYDLCPWARPPK